jgi:hypothetical protein
MISKHLCGATLTESQSINMMACDNRMQIELYHSVRGTIVAGANNTGGRTWSSDKKGAPASRWSRVRIPAMAVNLLSVLICWTARGGWTWALLVEFAFLPCYQGNTLLSAIRVARKGWDRRYTNPQIYLFFISIQTGNLRSSFCLRQ